MGALELLTADLTFPILVVVLVLQAIVAIIYWGHLPAMARLRAASLLARFLPASLRTKGAAVPPLAVDETTPKH